MLHKSLLVIFSTLTRSFISLLRLMLKGTFQIPSTMVLGKTFLTFLCVPPDTQWVHWKFSSIGVFYSSSPPIPLTFFSKHSANFNCFNSFFCLLLKRLSCSALVPWSTANNSFSLEGLQPPPSIIFPHICTVHQWNQSVRMVFYHLFWTK